FDRQSASVVQFVPGDEVRTDRGERVEGLCSKPLTIAELEVTRGHVIESGVTGDVFDGGFDRDMPGSAADDGCQFGLKIDLPAHLRDHNGVFRADNGTSVHCKEKRLLGWLNLEFFDVISVIHPDADDFLWMQQRSAERDIGGLKQEALDTAGGAF